MSAKPLEKLHYSPLRSSLVVFSAALFFLYIFVQMNSFNALTPLLIKHFHISALQVSSLFSYYFYGTVLFLFPAGILLDRFSNRWLVSGATLITILSLVFFAYSDHLWQAKLARFIMGVMGTLCLLSCVRLASRWFPAERLALVIGLVVTMAMLGGMLAQTPMTLLVDHYGFVPTLLVDALLGVFFLFFIVLFVRDYPREPLTDFGKNHQHTSGGGHFWQDLLLALSNKQNWFAGLYTSLMNLPIFLLGATWSSFYLTQIHHMTRDKASLVTTMVFVGTIIGSPMVGWISDHLRRRLLPMVVAAILALLIILLIMFLPNLSFLMAAFLYLMLGFITSAQIISYPLIAESNPSKLVATAEGLASTIIMLGGLVPMLFAQLLTWHWDHHMLHGLPVYALHNYRLALAIMPVAFVLSLICTGLLNETYCRARNKKQ